ncbi:hypothetical protein G6F50_015905 [Rhizopus delemar]|uniref:Uncharacterized protein n=1 Tax=Rhizopus delemar TaxID=936053 RepID=A0A9P6XV98_9FUNG|nr:hypothetical protein G6F50_015905 [Rhizopus delemar]
MTALAQHPRRALELLGAGTLDEQRNRGREGEVVYVQAVKTQVVGAAEQEAGLAAVAGQFEATVQARFGHRGEVHRGGDVLQARPAMHVVVHVVAVERAHGAIVAVMLVELAAVPPPAASTAAAAALRNGSPRRRASPDSARCGAPRR